jgi:hypothetical protein
MNFSHNFEEIISDGYEEQQQRVLFPLSFTATSCARIISLQSKKPVHKPFILSSYSELC